MTTTHLYLSQPLKGGLVNSGKWLLRILVILLVAYLGFFSYVAVHEWGGHIFADLLVFARHGTYIESLEVRVQWLSIMMGDGRWTAGFGPFRLGGLTWATPHNPFPLTEWEEGFSNLMGSGITTLISLIALTVLNLRKNVRRFPWFASTFVLYTLIFDQILYTFTGPDPEPLVSAILMGINPIFFKGLVIGLVLLQLWLLVRSVLRYRRARRVTT
jgi:hypothetical protein